jgi:anaerobic ribonucleoside-triphosphate reductase activating protein
MLERQITMTKYAEILDYDTNNGQGFRVSIWFSGCGKVPKCRGCFNKKLWDFNYGNEYTKETEDYIISILNQPLISGLNLIGGEVTDNLEDGKIISLVKRVKETYPSKTIFCWSGYTYEFLITNPLAKEFLSYIDMLRDGEYIEDLRDISQYLGGSKNQRCVAVQESLKQNKVVLWNKEQDL